MIEKFMKNQNTKFGDLNIKKNITVQYQQVKLNVQAILKILGQMKIV